MPKVKCSSSAKLHGFIKEFGEKYFGALPICDLPVSMLSTVLQVAEVAGSIV
jgi:hypothetical protein